MLRFNNIIRPLSRRREMAWRRLNMAMDSAWYPDMIIKAFLDIDTLFFGRGLAGRVVVRWAYTNRERPGEALATTRTHTK